MEGMMEGIEFERKFIETVCELILLKGINHTKFAKLVYGDVEHSVVKWRRTRNTVGRTGRPQKLPMADAWAMAMALDKSFSELCFTVEQKIKSDS
jgi:hypothetical protein